MLRTASVVIASALLALSFSCFAAETAPAAARQSFRDYVGTCQGRATDELWDNAIAWGRWDFDWNAIEPKPGEWNQDRFNKMAERVTEARAKNGYVLPILDYNALWAVDRGERSFVWGNQRISFKPLADGKFEKTVAPLDPKSKKEPVVKTVGAGKRFPLAAEHVKDWENYVRKVVSALRQPPYNVEYFQIWNEAHPESSFWDGDMDDYATRVHLPAAKIIRELGGKVVYGGWPCCGSLGQYINLMDKHKLWATVDVVDVHYFPMSSFEKLRQAAAKRGYPNMGVWQTEVAFTQDPGYVSNNYPRFLAWALEHQARADQYKMFFFPHGAPADPKAYGYLRGLWSGKELSLHGKSLKALGDLLAGDDLRMYKNFSATPVLKEEEDERLSAAEGFALAHRIVIAIHMAQNNDADLFVDWNGDGDTMHLSEGTPVVTVTLPDVSLNQIERVERVSAIGTRMTLAPEAVTEIQKGIKIAVPIRESTKEEAQIWTEKAKQARTFYLLVTLK